MPELLSHRGLRAFEAVGGPDLLLVAEQHGTGNDRSVVVVQFRA